MSTDTKVVTVKTELKEFAYISRKRVYTYIEDSFRTIIIPLRTPLK